MEKRNVVGERARQARKTVRPPITQAELVARLQVLGMQVDQSGLSEIESGRRPVRDFKVITLAKALNGSVAWLLKEADTSSTSGC